MRRWLTGGVLLLAACQGTAGSPVGDSSGDRLEAAALAAGLVVDPARRSLVGSWARDTDRACVVPGSGVDPMLGVMVDYGAGQGCLARGTVRRRGEALDVRFGDCRFVARFDGNRITFPAEVPVACDRLCSGRASLAALSVEALSTSSSEAGTLRAPDRRPLCAT